MIVVRRRPQDVCSESTDLTIMFLGCSTVLGVRFICLVLWKWFNDLLIVFED